MASQGYATTQQLDTQSSTVTQAQSTIAIDDALVAAAQTQLDFTTIRAPFDGVAGLRLTDVGNVVHPTDATGLVVVTQVQPITAVFPLPSADIAAVYAALKRGKGIGILQKSRRKGVAPVPNHKHGAEQEARARRDERQTEVQAMPADGEIVEPVQRLGQPAGT